VKAEALTPADIFGYHVRYVVPLFQRPYVWNQADQWEPLWDDVCAVAQRLLRLWPVLAPTAGKPDPIVTAELSRLVAPHFLGAIVVEQAPTLVGSIQSYHIIDGQQRLTTLQLLLDATSRVAEKYGDPEDARRLRQLVVNDPAVRHDDEIGKLWPSLSDRDAYLATMVGQTSPSGSPVADAHAYFTEAVRVWAHEDATPGATAVRLHVLARAISGYLRAVVIHLDPGDNAQGIFETLNHRGAPLLAADLIKNLVFRVAQNDGLDVVALYQKYWADLDRPYWRSYVKRGRQVVPRIDVFLHYWLIMRLVHEVRADQIFVSFRDHLGQAGVPVEDLLRELNSDARTYAGIAEAVARPSTSTVDRFCYRVFAAMDAGVVAPFYLWLMRWPVHRLPLDQRDRALGAMESWLIRRWLCGLSTKDNSNVVLELVAALDKAGPATAGYVTELFCFQQTSASRVWPSDDAVAKAVKTQHLDARVLRPRLRMLLEAVEDRWREDHGEHGAPCERDLSVEHIMPLEWRSYWVPVGAAAAALRDSVRHTLGNLTLIRGRFTEEQSVAPWTDAAARADGLGTGKRSELAQHGFVRITADAAARETWTESTITERTASLAEVVVRVWPRPETTPQPTVPGQRGAAASPASYGESSFTLASAGFDGDEVDGSELDDGGFAGLDTVGLDSVGLDTVGLDTVGLDIGFDAVGFDAAGFDPVGFGDSDYEEADFGEGGLAGETPSGSDVGAGRLRRVREGGLRRAGGATIEGGLRRGDSPEEDDDDFRLDSSAMTAAESDVDVSRAGAVDPEGTGADDGGSAEAPATRYALLVEFLATQTADTIPMTFEQVEDIMQDVLPPSARTSIPFWSSTNVALGRAIVAGGFKPTNVDLWNERVIFARDTSGRRPRRPRQNTRRRGPARQGGLDR
jgi:hypothetical protein